MAGNAALCSQEASGASRQLCGSRRVAGRRRAPGRKASDRIGLRTRAAQQERRERHHEVPSSNSNTVHVPFWHAAFAGAAALGLVRLRAV